MPSKRTPKAPVNIFMRDSPGAWPAVMRLLLRLKSPTPSLRYRGEIWHSFGNSTLGEGELGTQRNESARERPPHPGQDARARDDVGSNRSRKQPIAHEHHEGHEHEHCAQHQHLGDRMRLGGVDELWQERKKEDRELG